MENFVLFVSAFPNNSKVCRLDNWSRNGNTILINLKILQRLKVYNLTWPFQY